MEYNQPELARKAQKLSEMYDFRSWRDVFTVTIQEMELAEIRAKVSPSDRSATVSKVVMGAAQKQGVALDPNLLAVYMDDIAAAAKGKFAINKGPL